MKERRKLSDILTGQARHLQSVWDQTAAADDFAPLPAGEYAARILSGELFTSKKGTPGYKLTFEVAAGDHEGRRVWHDVWLTPAALPMTIRDLGKIGITDLAQLDNPLPAVLLCRLKLSLRRDDDGNDFNRVRSFDVIGVEQEPFAPADQEGGSAS